MTTKDEALRQALTALETLQNSHRGYQLPSEETVRSNRAVADLAIATCRKALNLDQYKSDQDSFVVWVHPGDLQQARKNPFMCRVEPTQRLDFFVPLYNK